MLCLILKRSNVIILLLFNFYQLKKVTINVCVDYLSPQQYELCEKKKVTISSNLPIFFRLIIFLKTILITSLVYRFLQIQVPYLSYNKLYKDPATINLVDQVSKL